MLICFGSSWPFAIYKSLQSKSAAGKSIVFLSLILAGYAFGIAYKLMKQLDAVTWLYVMNAINDARCRFPVARRLAGAGRQKRRPAVSKQPYTQGALPKTPLFTVAGFST